MKGDRWFKFHVKAIWSPSLRKLTATQRWIWSTLLALATEGDGIIRGNAANLSHISAASATDVRGMQQAVAKMQHLCLINVNKNGDIKIRNWSKYQSTTAERRKRKVRQNGGDNPKAAATEEEVRSKNEEVRKTPTAEEAKEHYVEKLGHELGAKMESVIYDFKNTRKTKKLAPAVLIRIVDYWLKFSSQLLLEAKSVWDEQRYAHEGKDEKYFNGILRRLAKEVEIRRASQVGAHR